MSKAVDPVEGGKDLLAAVIAQALADAQQGAERCNGGCKGGAHVCRADAVRFLRGPACADFLAWLDLDPDTVQPAIVAQALGRRRAPAPAGRQLGLFAWAGAARRPAAALKMRGECGRRTR